MLYLTDESLSEWKKFPAQQESYEEIRDFIMEKVEHIGIDTKAEYKFELGIEEIIVNIISYAYESEVGDIFIKVVEDKLQDKIILDIVDYGIPFNPLEKNDPRAVDKSAIEDREIGGFGIAFVKKVFSELSYVYEPFFGKNANHLKLVFKKT